MSVVFGTTLAVTVGHARISWPLFLLSTLAMVALHAASNLLNDACDHDRGLDTRVLPVSGAVVRGYLTASQARRAAALLFGVGAALGLVIAWRVGWPVLLLGGAGLLLGVLYSASPAGLKYHALGDLAVFLAFGVLGSLGAWTVQTGRPALLPALWAIPLSLLVVGILHANNWRDRESDAASGCVTIASTIGDRRSEHYHALLLFAPFALIALFMVVPRLTGLGVPMPLPFAVTALALPLALRLRRRGRERRTAADPLAFLALDGGTAQLNLLFGALCTLALLLDAWLGRLA